MPAPLLRLVACSAFAGVLHAAPERPNIVLVYTDDQAAWTLGAYGNEQAATPHLDRLAREGVRLTNAFVATPVCSPSRAEFMTSRYGTELGILDFIPPKEHREFTPAYGRTGLPTELPTLPETLTATGYETALFGKWHLGDWRDDPERRFHPTRHGFAHFVGFVTGAGPKDPETVAIDGSVTPWRGLTDDIITDHAIQFLRRKRTKPVFVQLNLRSPHSPWLPVAEEDRRPFENLDPKIPDLSYPDLDVVDVKRRMRDYLSSVAGIDRNVGRLLRALADAGLEENTLVIFTSDHGYNLGHNGIWHKGNGIWITRTMPPDDRFGRGRYRPNLYDNSLRVPVIVRWPGVIPAGSVVTDTFSNLDWFPTLARLAGAAIPEGTVLRGSDFAGRLRGDGEGAWNQDFYAEYSMQVYRRADLRCYRTPEWKLVRDFLQPENDELYHLREDPEENENLINDASPRVRAALQRLDAQLHAQIRRIEQQPLHAANPDRKP